jgi:hypothetical protein
MLLPWRFFTVAQDLSCAGRFCAVSSLCSVRLPFFMARPSFRRTAVTPVCPADRKKIHFRKK